jgi:hypothetical protein
MEKDLLKKLLALRADMEPLAIAEVQKQAKKYRLVGSECQSLRRLKDMAQKGVSSIPVVLGVVYTKGATAPASYLFPPSTP